MDRRKKSRSKSQRKQRNQGQGKEKPVKAPETPKPMLPSFMDWTGTGPPWQKSTPESRLARVSTDLEDVPPPPLLPPPPKPGPDPEEVPVEVKQHIENLQKSLGSAFTPKLEQDILAAAKAPAVAPKLEITHTDLNRAKQARTQYEAANGKLKEVDTKWKQFNHGLQAAYNVEHEEYKQKRAAALEDLQNKKVKLQEIQERIKNSAMNHNLVEEEPTDIPATGGFQMMDPIEVDIGSEDEELAEHQPVPCFGRTKASPTRQAEQPLGGIPKKVKQESGAASTGVGAGHVKS